MTPAKAETSAKATLITYRPEIKVFDCTIRDGGLINNHFWEDDFVAGVYQACIAAGVDYMEIGYKNSAKILAPAKFGRWKHCDEDDIRRIVDDNPSDLKISVMADAERSEYKTQIVPQDKSPVDMVRVATYSHQLPLALDMVKDAKDKGYEVGCNIMALSAVNDRDLGEALELIAKSEADVAYIVDSFGYFVPEHIHHLTTKFLRALKDTGKQVGIHAHNNQQLAFANTIEALRLGANCLDASINGLGRGAGNCPIEILLGFLRNPKFHQRPIFEFIEKQLMTMRDKIEWGYQLPYLVTGQLNTHPRDAIKWRAGESPDAIVDFFDQMMDGR